MQNLRGAGNDTGTETGNTEDKSMIESNSFSSRVGEGNQNKYHSFYINEIFSFQEVEME